IAALAIVLAVSCGGETTPPDHPIPLATIVIDRGARQLERGSVVTLTATTKDTAGKVISVPVVWRSSVDSIASFGRDVKLTAGVPGSAIVTASALGITSGGVEIRVVWQGSANVAALRFSPPNAVTPGSDLGD